jgi:hypothetical protein
LADFHPGSGVCHALPGHATMKARHTHVSLLLHYLQTIPRCPSAIAASVRVVLIQVGKAIRLFRMGI